jgi:endonuclease YncB( thermonuclease family)
LVQVMPDVSTIKKPRRRLQMSRKEKVTKVIDGDTFLTNRRKHPVRLANVDTPEKRQSGYQNAKKELEKLILNQEVTVDTKARDKYQRTVADVKIGNRSVNKAMERYQKK